MKGYYRKYVISKIDGSPIDPEADYFVLRVDSDQDAREAAKHYAGLIVWKNPILAGEITRRMWEYEANETRPEVHPAPKPLPLTGEREGGVT